MCAGVAELSERWTVDLEVRPMQVRTSSEIFCFHFYSFPTNKFIFMRRESRGIKFFILREYKPEVKCGKSFSIRFAIPFNSFFQYIVQASQTVS